LLLGKEKKIAVPIRSRHRRKRKKNAGKKERKFTATLLEKQERKKGGENEMEPSSRLSKREEKRNQPRGKGHRSAIRTNHITRGKGNMRKKRLMLEEAPQHLKKKKKKNKGMKEPGEARSLLWGLLRKQEGSPRILPSIGRGGKGVVRKGMRVLVER